MTDPAPGVLWCPFHETDQATVVHVDLAPHEGWETGALAWLDKPELARRRRFAHPRPQREFTICRTVLRELLCRRLSCRNDRLAFETSEHGKPFAKVAGQPVETGFNVSHSGRHGLIAIARQGCIGVDVEERVAQRDLEGIGSLVFGPAERRFLARTEGREKVNLFYRLWSMKEALLKALGTGFSLSPARFEVPGPMLWGDRSGVFRFPHLPSEEWRLLDLGEPRFAAALAYRLSSSSSSSHRAP